MTTTPTKTKEKTHNDQTAQGGRSAVPCSGRIVVGDLYRKKGRIIEIVEVTDSTVAYVHTDYFGNMSGHALTRRDFDRLEDATLKNGADFVPALNA